MINNIIKVQYFKVGYCKQCEAFSIGNGKWSKIAFPSLVALIHHKTQGYILFDVGYSTKFYTATATYPNKLYAKVTPVYLEQNEELPAQLNKIGVATTDIATVILSHLHVDHIAGLEFFEHAKILISRSCYEFNMKRSKLMALANGFIPAFMPKTAKNNIHYVENTKLITLPSIMAPFDFGYDLFGDQSIIAIELAGHAKGQIGLFINGDEKIFLVADAAWSSEAIRKNIPPHLLTFLLHHNRKQYLQTLNKLHLLYNNTQDVRIIPSHCSELWVNYVG